MRISPFDAIGTAVESQLSARESLSLAGLDFDVVLEPVKNSRTGDVVLTENDPPEPKYFQVIRTDRNDVLGIVEGRFTPLQNRDVFGIADAMVQTGARIVRAAEIEQGARCFMTLEWTDDHAIHVVDDIVGRRAIIQNAHNGKYSALIRLMPLRKACTNGLILPVPGAEFEFRIKHTVGSEERLIEAAEVISRADDYFSHFSRTADLLAQTSITSEHASSIMWGVPEFKGKEKSPAVQKKVARVLSLFEGEQRGADMDGLKGTTWGLLNAVSEFADYDEESRVRVTKGTTSEIQRFKSAFGGTNQRLKLNFFDVLMKDQDLALRSQLSSSN